MLRPAAQSLFASHNAHCPQDVTQPLAFENRGFSFVIDKVRGAGALGTDVVLRGAVDTSRASCATALLVNVCTPYMPRLLLQGTIDQLLGSGSSRQQAVASATAALRVLHAAMRPGGTLLLLSHSSPARRTQLLSCCNWEAVQVREQRARWTGGSCHVQLNVLFAVAMCAAVTAMHVRPSRALYAAGTPAACSQGHVLVPQPMATLATQLKSSGVPAAVAAAAGAASEREQHAPLAAGQVTAYGSSAQLPATDAVFVYLITKPKS